MIQLQFLNSLLKSQDSSLLSINNLNKEFFSDYTKEFEYIKEHLDTYGKIPDTVSFLDAFPDFDIIEVNESNDYLIDELYKDKNKRDLATVFNKVRTLLQEDRVEDAMQLFTNASQDAVKAKHLDCVDLLKDTGRYDAYVERCQDFNKFYVKTGFKELDEIIGGWDRQEELATIVARPNVGKSWMLLKCAVAALEQDLNVGIYSGEMSERKVGYRVDTLISHLPNSGLTRGDLSLQNMYKTYLNELPNKYRGSLKVLTPNMIGGPAGVTSLRAFIEKEDLDILFIDQHSLLEDDRKAKSPVEKAANISKDLKNLQVLKHIPIISVSQQNRNSTENGVGLEHVAQADRIGQDSTIVLFFEREDNNIINMHLVKSRDSVNMKKLSYSADFNCGKLLYIPEETNALDGAGAEELKAQYEDDGVDVF